MREIQITPGEAGQRLDKLLAKYLNLATKSFIYKMLRKKNIVLNDKKASGNEKLKSGDSVKLYLAEETIEKFSQKAQIKSMHRSSKTRISVVYEDENLLCVNKPVGILSQKASASDVSINEQILSYLTESGSYTEEQMQFFRPSICNRLDRNTSGLIAAGKTLSGSQFLNQMFRERTLGKYYLCLVKGRPEKHMAICGYLIKDSAANKVKIISEEDCRHIPDDAVRIETEYRTLATNGQASLLEVHLITGKSHQIRAHLASIGHPIAGDTKYGNQKFNSYYQKKYGLKSQLLHAYRLEFPECNGDYTYLSGTAWKAELPRLFSKILKDQGVDTWEHGNPEG
jgi:23S rRNA pseudouridine955/2504/2580 synthase